MGKFHDRTGETIVNRQNLKMKIINYVNADNIDVEFEDGFISKNKTFTAFRGGRINNPNYHKSNICSDRLNETRVNKQNLKMTIIRYDNYDDIDVLFEDGTILKNKSYRYFKNSGLENKNYDTSLLGKDRVGEIGISNRGLKMQIIEYRKSNDVDVLFDNGYIAKHKSYSKFTEGNIRNKLFNSCSGVGCIGDGDITIGHKFGNSSILDIWIAMLHRCYDKTSLKKRPRYEDVSVCEKWLNFQVFSKYYIDNYYCIDDEKMCLDKDILFKNNKIYSESTCLIVPQRINSLFSKANASRGEYPIGVHYNKKICKFVAGMSVGWQKIKYIGCFGTPEEAFYAYKKSKENYIKQVADEYKNIYPQFPKKVYDAMYAYQVDITD